jgi:hypothetical protein
MSGTPAAAQNVTISGISFAGQNAGRAWSYSRPQAGTHRFEVRAGDKWPGDGASRVDRSELSAAKRFAAGDIITMEFDFMLEPGPASSAAWLVFWQIHHDSLHGSPPVSLELFNATDRMRVSTRNASGVHSVRYAEQSPLERGRTYRFKIETRIAEANGYLKVWRDGVQLVDYAGPFGYNIANYVKFGIYRAETNQTIAARYSRVSVAAGAMPPPSPRSSTNWEALAKQFHAEHDVRNRGQGYVGKQ